MWIQEERSTPFQKSLQTAGKPEWKLKTGTCLPSQVSVLERTGLCSGLHPETRFSCVSNDYTLFSILGAYSLCDLHLVAKI